MAIQIHIERSNALIDFEAEDYDFRDFFQDYIVFTDYEGNKLSSLDLSPYTKDEAMTDYGHVEDIAVDAEGNISLVLKYFFDDGVTFGHTVRIIGMDSNGKITGKERLFNLVNESASTIMDASGNVITDSFYYDGMLTVYNDQGQVDFAIDLYSLQHNHLNLSPSMPESLVKIDGKVYFCAEVVDKDSQSISLFEIDMNAKTLGEEINAPALGTGIAYFTEHGAFVKKPSGIFSYNIESHALDSVFSWKDVDIDLNVFPYENAYPISADKCVVISASDVSAYYEASYANDTSAASAPADPTKILVMTREAKNPNAGKSVLVIGGFGVYNNPVLNDAIYRFNTSDSEYRVELVDYSDQVDFSSIKSGDYSSYVNAYANVTQSLYRELMDGKGPDVIVSGDSGIDVDRYVNRKLLVDISALMKKDKEFKPEDYMENILKAYETDGKMYEFPVSVSLSGWVGVTEYVGDTSGWTLEEFIKTAETIPDTVTMFDNMTQQDLLEDMMSTSLHQFIDYKNGAANFSDERFYSMLNAAKNYGLPEGPVEEMGAEGEEFMPMQFSVPNKFLALAESDINSPMAIDQYEKASGTPLSYVGYPSESALGLACESDLSFSITSTCGDQDAAWRFLKNLIGDEAQESVGIQDLVQGEWEPIHRSIPVLKSAIDSQIASYIEKNGISEESGDKYIEIIESAGAVSRVDEQIMSVINEEASLFFADQKSAEDTASVINDRLKALLGERQ